MKIIKFILLLLLSQAATGQNTCIVNDTTLPCCNGLIHTGPDAGKAVNTERPAFKNLFDWRTDDYNTYHPLGGYTDGMGGPLQMPNPFKGTDSVLSSINYRNIPIPQRNPLILDYKPEHGWELLHRNLGYRPDETTTANTLENRPAPYIILYNKTTGLLRIFAALDEVGPQTVKVNLDISKPNGTNNYKTSALFGYYGNEAQTLDEKSNIKVHRTSNYPGQKAWFMADFTVAYDPCICNNEGRLIINFETVTNARVTMDGRLIATSASLNGSGTSPLLNGKDFLLSLNQGNGGVNGGMQTYHNIDALVAKYKTPVGLSALENKGIDLFGQILKEGLKSYNPLASRLLTNAATALTYKFITPGKIQEFTGNDSIAVGIDIASKASDFFVTALKPDIPPTPNYSFIEGELKLAGTVTTTTFNSNFEITLEQPGSKSSQYQSPTPNSDWKFYPAYNEALGLMAVLEKPTLRAYIPRYAYGASPQSWKIHQRHYELDKFEYFFNPAAGIDTSKTIILMALQGKFKSTNNTIGNFHRVLDADNSDTNLYSTDYFPPECLHGYVNEYAVWDEVVEAATNWHNKVVSVRNHYEFDAGYFVGSPVYIGAITQDIQYMADRIALYYPEVTVSHFFNDDDFNAVISLDQFLSVGYRYFADSILQKRMLDFDLKLKVLIDYKFKENSYGVSNETLNGLTFKTNTAITNPIANPPTNKLGRNIPRYVSINNSTVFYGDTLIEAYDTIFVDGQLINWPSTPIRLESREILVKEPSNVNGADVTLRSSLLPSRGCRSIKIGQVSPQMVKNFCSSTAYRAQEPKFKTEPIISEPQNNKSKKTLGFSLYPNPTSSVTNMVYTVESETLQDVEISVMDMLGRPMGIERLPQQKSGKYEAQIHLEEYPAGIYFVTLKIGNNTRTQKVVLIGK